MWWLSPQALWRKINSNIRHKLLVLVLFPILVVTPLLLGMAIYWGHSLAYEQLYIKVNTDLSVSQNIFRRIQKDYLTQLEAFAESQAFQQSLKTPKIQAQLQQFQQQQGFSYLALVTPHQTAKQSLLWQQAQQGKAVSGVEIFSHQELKQLDEGLAQVVRLPLLDTQYARPTDRSVEDQGMMVRVLYPLKDQQQNVKAILDAGVLLNGNFELVDAIRDLVYGEGSLPIGSLGTVTIFLDDVRISTNVPLKAGERALGTRVSSAVHERVMMQGENWINRAFVVNDWYISGYTPILDSAGQRIGILYAGFLEKPFREDFWNTLLVLLGLLLLVVIGSTLLTIHGAHSIFQPLERMSDVIQATRQGKTKRVGQVKSRDEIAELAHELDAMLDLLQQQKQAIEQSALELEHKVEQRTLELKEKNQDLSRTIQVLRQTRNQLVTAEKLAAMGELTAGVAHEINNPVAVILGNTDMLAMILGQDAEPVQQEIDLIIEQVERIREIIDNLLQYARPNELTDELDWVDVNEVVEQTFKLIAHLSKTKFFQLEKQCQATQLVKINPHELQQVLINLLRNAIHAIPEQGGVIRITTRNRRLSGVALTVEDNGVGIPEANLNKIFNPFFTTKRKQGEEGTGLGLSLSYGLVHRYGGDISVESQTGETVFTVRLLPEPVVVTDKEVMMQQLYEND